MVLSVAAIAGGALLAPIIWSLYSSRQTGFSVVFTTLVALVVSLSLKVVMPYSIGYKLDRSLETFIGVGLPLLVLAVFEYYYYANNRQSSYALALRQGTRQIVTDVQQAHHEDAQRQNRFGITVIALAAAFVGAGIALLGVLASGQVTVVAVGGVIFLLACIALYRYVLK